MATVEFVCTSRNAIPPKRCTAKSAGYDLHSAVAVVVAPRSHQHIATDICLRLPTGTYGRIAARSGLAFRHAIDVGAGIIDEDYRGPIGVILFNHSDVPFVVNIGDRIAQLIIQTYLSTATFRQVDSLDDETERGTAGFGSTGVSSIVNPK
ncbi:dUTPase [Musca domestica salivary gland hypertrophy virus]|uniref:dUTP diphosphatase n=1 Tax=Musca hytrovirus(isolate Musca domestica/United States/Boucias/-) TaxID=523909 RepID=B2YG29_MHVB|nr:dUTPase [Musca domestica salivary gland hypertrophy virus]ACD03511.1 dUTPase [Musca domestica salivary gland hypertrophy virus]